MARVCALFADLTFAVLAPFRARGVRVRRLCAREKFSPADDLIMAAAMAYIRRLGPIQLHAAEASVRVPFAFKPFAAIVLVWSDAMFTFFFLLCNYIGFICKCAFLCVFSFPLFVRLIIRRKTNGFLCFFI